MSVWIGRFDKEGGGQSEAAWTRNESSPAGVIGWSGPPGERWLSFSRVLRLTHALSCSGSLLFFGPVGLSGSWGSKTAEGVAAGAL